MTKVLGDYLQEKWEMVPQLTLKCNECKKVTFEVTSPEDKILYHRLRKFDVICHNCKNNPNPKVEVNNKQLGEVLLHEYQKH